MPNPAKTAHRRPPGRQTPQELADAADPHMQKLAALREWRAQAARRDRLVIEAIEEGIGDDIIELHSGIARSTVRRIFAKHLRGDES